MNNKIKFVISITICQFAGIIGSIFTASSVTNWYVTLEKPDFTPPGWIFAPIWVIMYFLMGISLYLLWISKTKDNRKAFTVFAVQLILNASWSFLFFGLKSPLYGLIDILFLLAAIMLTILFLYKISVLASVLLVPYLVWVIFATMLNYNILLLN
ncbi:MAG TPA: TspO/MBR family protein [Nitrososphaeraceae archaeon]|nr:TspO/MBR family protein [Nitrososphaeraceae archaeon]